MVGMVFVMIHVSIVVFMRLAVSMNVNIQTRFPRKALEVVFPDTEYQIERNLPICSLEDSRSWNEISDKVCQFLPLFIIDQVKLVQYQNICHGDLVYREPTMLFIHLINLLGVNHGQHTVHSRPRLQFGSHKGQ